MIDLIKESLIYGAIGSAGATTFIFIFVVLRRFL